MNEYYINGNLCERVKLTKVKKGTPFYLSCRTNAIAYVKAFKYSFDSWGCDQVEFPEDMTRFKQVKNDKLVYAVKQ